MLSDFSHISGDTKTFGVCFAGYNTEKGRDDLVYVVLNTHWEDVEIKLPSLPRPLFWHLCVNTYGDGRGRYFYPEGEAIRITKEFIMRPRSVAVFIGK